MSTADIQRTENGNSISIQSNYIYNQSGIRVRASNTVNSITQTRIFMLDSGLTGYQQVLEESETVGGDLIKSYTLGDDIISQNVAHNTQPVAHFLYDGHGSTRLLTDNTGTVTDTYDYDAYGIQLGQTSNTTNQAATDILYSGEQFDNNLQMQYFRARYYDQNNGIFNRLDPFSGNNSDPQSLHKYAYCHGDPVNGVDYLGLLTVHIWNYRGSTEAWGHAALTLEDGTHISWWPSGVDRRGMPLLPMIYTATANDPQTYTDDVSLEGQVPDKQIKIHGLNESAIKTWWLSFKTTHKWKTLSQNCSTTVADALKAGGGTTAWWNIWDNWNIVWTPSDVEEYAEEINEYLDSQNKILAVSPLPTMMQLYFDGNFPIF